MIKKVLALALGAIMLSSGAIAQTINVSWTYDSNCDGFRIYDKMNELVVEVGPDARTASFEEIECNSWRAVAFRGDLESKISISAQWCPEPPAAPGGLRIN